MTAGTEATAAPTPEAAVEQRAALMADTGFRQRAAAGGAEWQQLVELDRIIAADAELSEALHAAELELAQVAPARQSGTDHDTADAENAEPGFAPPDTPSGYVLPVRQALDAGLEIDFAADAELRAALHAAGVDTHLAQLLYSAAIHAAARPQTPVEAETERRTSESALRERWGADYDAKLAAAIAEGRRIFESMPESARGGETWADWCASSGLGNNRVLIEALHRRAAARGQ